MPKRNTFSREFKLEAIRQMEAGDKKAADLARELGVPRAKSGTDLFSLPPRYP